MMDERDDRRIANIELETDHARALTVLGEILRTRPSADHEGWGQDENRRVWFTRARSAVSAASTADRTPRQIRELFDEGIIAGIASRG